MRNIARELKTMDAVAKKMYSFLINLISKNLLASKPYYVQYVA